MNNDDVDNFLTYAIAGKDGVAYLREWLYRKFGKDKVMAAIAGDTDED